MSSATLSQKSGQPSSPKLASDGNRKLTPEELNMAIQGAKTFLRDTQSYQPKRLPQTKDEEILSRLT